jgi:hypothetical protein
MCPSMNLLMQLLGSARKTTPIFDVRGRGWRQLVTRCGLAARKDGAAQQGVVRLAERELWNIRARFLDYSGLMLAIRITLPHFSVSSAMNLPKVGGRSPKHRATQLG